MRLRDPRRVPIRISRPVTPSRISRDDADAVTSAEPEFLELVIGPVAHGGHCVARIPAGPDAGRVVFVRHALPGERVRARLTDKGKIWRADAVEILGQPSPYRVESSWPAAGADGVGGGELAHVSLAGQRLWKAAVLAEQMRRLAGLDVAEIAPSLAVSAKDLTPLSDLLDSGVAEVSASASCLNTASANRVPGGVEMGVESVGQSTDSAGQDNADQPGEYRTRIDLLVDDAGKVGMRQARSHRIVPLKNIPIATKKLQTFAAENGVWDGNWHPGDRLALTAPATSRWDEPDSEPLLVINGEPIPRANAATGLVETVTVGGRMYHYQVAPDGFWQVHAQAPETLINAVLADAGDLSGKKVLELYSGAGLFTLPLAVGIGADGQLVTVEGSKTAVKFAQQNLAALKKQLPPKSLPKTEQLAGTVSRTLAKLATTAPNSTFDLLIVDPPREGLEKGVTEQIAAFSPSSLIYISCDPAALARDTNRLHQNGYQLTKLRAFDLFPMTHHLESVALFEKTNSG